MRFIHTDKAAAAVGPYSQATDTGSLVFVSGQLGLSPTTGELAQGFAAQTRQALDNLRAILEGAGLGLDSVAVVEVFVTDMGAFPEFNALYADFFGEHKPARAVVEVSALPKGGLVEVKCTAVR
ncbi:Rid family detoxifying hydrolase [Desulfocurvus sp.]|jgi:2-iminobutanoate/2-iminopropanoate deaminase|uniref:Rid family detoxifying hydrolase n=1 Tax=Desulfocurvus sp. TaxID=2871698 RepID=UPI0025BD14BC|nr:Rid family detoxifying hydrolase [Desulfocurvus sp.]MCK9240461.1 Rid family detoxifying hydrolase [Desulfocurvus sp.]